MKKLLIALIIISFLTSTALSQRTFAPLNAEWKYEYWSPNCPARTHTVLRVDQELIIENKNCGVIQQYGINYYSGDLVKRNDSLIVWDNGDTVFFYEDNAFYPLLIFQGEVGDTLRTYRPKNADRFSITFPLMSYDSIALMPSVILDIDTVIIDGVARRKWNTIPTTEYFLEPCRDYRVIVEGIGSMHGLIGSSCIVQPTGCFGYFICYTDTLLHYESERLPGCAFSTSVMNIIKSSEIVIYPNPTSDVFYIENESDYAFSKVIVRSMDGRILLTQNFNSSVNLGDQPSGVYLVGLQTSQGLMYVERVLKF